MTCREFSQACLSDSLNPAWVIFQPCLSDLLSPSCQIHLTLIVWFSHRWMSDLLNISCLIFSALSRSFSIFFMILCCSFCNRFILFLIFDSSFSRMLRFCLAFTVSSYMTRSSCWLDLKGFWMIPPPVYTPVMTGNFCWNRLGGRLAVRHAFVNSAGGASLLSPCKVRLGVFIFEVATAKGFL